MSYIDETYGKQLEEALRGLVSRPALGQPWFGFHESEVPAGVLLFTATTHSRVLYADFWKYIQDKNLVKTEEEWQSIYSEQGWCPFYSDGDGIDTFRMPSAPLYLHGANTLGEAGKYIEAGLPNITGGHSGGYGSDRGREGAFSGTWITAETNGNGGDFPNNGIDKGWHINFDASHSSPIYGNSDTVTPETSKMLFGVWAISAPQQPIPDATVEGIISELGIASNNVLEANSRAEAAINGLNGVVRSVNGVSANAAGDVGTVDSFNTNYVRYVEGTQICWANKPQGDWTFPKPYISRPIVTVAPVVGTTNPGIHIGPPSTTSVNVGNSAGVSMDIIAIGRWK